MTEARPCKVSAFIKNTDLNEISLQASMETDSFCENFNKLWEDYSQKIIYQIKARLMGFWKSLVKPMEIKQPSVRFCVFELNIK